MYFILSIIVYIHIIILEKEMNKEKLRKGNCLAVIKAEIAKYENSNVNKKNALDA